MSLVKGLSAQLKPQDRSVLASFYGSSYDLAELSQYLDLVALTKESIEKAKKSKVPSSKLILNIIFAGHEGVYDEEGDFIPKNWVSYDEVCQIESNTRNVIYNKTYDENSSLTHIHYANQYGMNYYIKSESTRAVAQETRFAIRNGFNGVHAFTIDMDDSQGKCKIETDTFDDFKPMDGVTLNIPARAEKTFPLLRTINDGIVVSVDEIEQEKQLNSTRPNRPFSNRPGGFFSNLVNNFLSRPIFSNLFNNRPQRSNTRFNEKKWTPKSME